MGDEAQFSFLSLLRHGVGKAWNRQWRDAQPRPSYDVVIVGAGGHGLATAFYLAMEHGIRNVAVLDKGWLGGGNTGRNTTIIRSNYLRPESAALYEHSLRLWQDLAQALNYNVMYSARGVLMLAHNHHDVQVFKRHVHANRLQGIDNEWLTPAQAKAFCPPLDIGSAVRYPILGAALQRRGGVARHDAVAWGYARAASAMGVDIIQNCAVTGIVRDAAGAAVGVETTRGPIAAARIGVVAAGHTSVVMAMAGVRMPLESFPLQALVSEPVKPVMPCVVMSNTVHAYVSAIRQGRVGHRRRDRCLYILQPGRRPADHLRDATGNLRVVSLVSATEDAAELGRHRRYHPRPVSHHRADAGAGAVRQLRVGNRRLQGDARVGAYLRRHHRSRGAASDRRTFRPGPVRVRPVDR